VHVECSHTFFLHHAYKHQWTTHMLVLFFFHLCFGPHYLLGFCCHPKTNICNLWELRGTWHTYGKCASWRCVRWMSCCSITILCGDFQLNVPSFCNSVPCFFLKTFNHFFYNLDFWGWGFNKIILQWKFFKLIFDFLFLLMRKDSCMWLLYNLVW
jgi:hypothetical protein